MSALCERDSVSAEVAHAGPSGVGRAARDALGIAGHGAEVLVQLVQACGSG